MKDLNAHEIAATYPMPGDSPTERLAHTLAIFSDEPDTMQVLMATHNVYGDGVWTGITLGDLRGLVAAEAGPVSQVPMCGPATREVTR